MDYDVAALRRHFPALTAGAAHFDGPGGSQVPQEVAEAVAGTLTSAISNRGRSTRSERRADEIVTQARQAIADLVGGDPAGMVFGRSMTQLTYDMARTLAKEWSPGDEVVVTRLDHDANIRPWAQAAQAAGATIRWVEFDRDTTELNADHVAAVLSARTRLVAITGASNLIGTRPHVGGIAGLVHQAGALLYVDGVHLTPHAPVDIQAMGADFYVCSPYKFLGPHCGALAAAPDLLETLHPDKLLPSTDDVPERFELGTLPYELLAGTTAAVDFLAGISPGSQEGRRRQLISSMTAIEAHERELCAQLEARLSKIEPVVFHGRALDRTPTLLFTVEGRSAGAASAALAAEGVNAPNGNFYAVEPARWLGLGDSGAVRAGVAPYTDQSDVDRLVEGLERIATGTDRGL
jgi:cysteine desulfurase family protein (TIGR01976 family)